MGAESGAGVGAAAGRSSLRRSGLAWLSGLLILAALGYAVSHLSEGRAFLALLQRAEPRWLLAALACQALTYVCAAAVWQRSLARSGVNRPLRELVPLGLAKLFTDQALPSAGVSGSLLIFRALRRRGIARGAALDALLTGVASYYSAYALSAIGAVVLLALRGHVGWLVLVPAIAVCALAVTVPIAVLRIRAGRADALTRLLRRLPGARPALEAIADVPGHPLTPRLLLEATALQLAVVGLDVATLDFALRAAAAPSEIAVVFPAFVIASAVATLGWVPGGLGTFEATCIALLHVHGVPLESAVAATVLLRGLTFWLPMPPGLVLAQRETGGRPPDNADERTPAISSGDAAHEDEAREPAQPE